jgi:hypothetical protein
MKCRRLRWAGNVAGMVETKYMMLRRASWKIEKGNEKRRDAS